MKRFDTIGRRLVAALVDALIFAPITVLYIIVESFELSLWPRFAVNVLGALTGISYNVLLHWKYGQTVGKMIAAVRVVDVHERPISFRQAFLRDIFFIAVQLLEFVAILFLALSGNLWNVDPISFVQESLLILYFLWILVDTIVCLKNSKYRALHDMVAGTVVVRSDIPEVDDQRMTSPPSPEAYGFSDERKKTENSDQRNDF